MIKQITIDFIFESVQIEDVINDFVTLKKRGVNYLGKCPFHNEKTPSFTVSPAKGIYKCFGCGKSGNAVGFIMDHEKKTYPEALRYLANKYSITVDEEKPDPEAEKKQVIKGNIIEFNNVALNFFQSQLTHEDFADALKYAKSRFSDDSINEWQIGYAPKSFTALYDHAIKNGYKDDIIIKSGLAKRSKKNGKIYDFFQERLIFPIWDLQGNLVSFTGRSLPGSDPKFAKFMNLPELPTYNKSNILYGLNFSIRSITKSKSVTLVEGNPDCIKLHQIGINNVVAPCGTALANGHIKLLHRFADKINLLYDGDSAGQAALIKNGKLLIEKGMIPYAAILPREHDPDTWFKDADHYNNWMNKYPVDFIEWYSDSLLKNIGKDPSLKNDAIIQICDLLIHVSKMKRDIYLQNITDKNKVALKLFKDQIKKLEASIISREKPKVFVPNNIDPNEFEKWGFYVENNSYHFRSKSGIEKLSNFIMKPIFHIDQTIDSKRIYELINEHGYSVVVNLDMNEMVSLQGFQRNVESKGNFMFWGQMQQFQKLKLKLYQETRTCVEIKNLGWQKEGFWAWANGMVNGDGSFEDIDEFGIVKHNDQDYFIPAFSKIYIRDKSIFIDERKFQYKESDVTLKAWMDLYLKVHGDNAMVAFAWYLSAIFRDHILYLNDNFPLLNLFGQKGSGKNTIAYSLLSLFGRKQTEFNIHNGTKPGLAKHLEMFRNSIAFIDEYKNSLDFDKIETLKSIYNAIGRSRLNMDKGGKKETTEVNQGTIVAGQEMPTIDVALSTRMIFLQFLTKEGLSPKQKKDFEDLQKMERNGLPHITVMFLKHRKYFIDYYKDNFDQVMKVIIEKTKGTDINDRLLRNICTVIASFKTLDSKFDFSFTLDQLIDSAIKITIEHNKQIKQSDEIGVFWNLMEALFDDDLLIDKWHFKVNTVTKLITKTNSYSFVDGKRVLRFKFNAIAKLYAEQLRRRGDKPLPLDSLQHYLKTSKHFICVERSCKFSRKDLVPAERKVIETKQTTTAFCFDYDALGINLERELETAIDSNNTSPYNDAIDHKPDDDLPF